MARAAAVMATLCGLVSLLIAAPCRGSTWYTVTLDNTPGAGSSNSIALDASGYPHVSYYNWASGHLMYANGRTFEIQTVDRAGDVGAQNCLALDASGYPHISYYHYMGYQAGELKYAAWNGAGWEIKIVDSEEDVGGASSLALDASGYPHISYYDSEWEALRYAVWNGTNWDIQMVQVAGDVGASNSLALDASGYPHISYYVERPDKELKYAAWNGTNWDIETVESVAEQTGISNSLALDANGFPHISYYFSWASRDLKYAAWNGTSWVIQTVDSEGSVGRCTSLALDASGRPHISYHDYTNTDLKYAVWNGTSWDIETVNAGVDVGCSSSLALDADGFAHISYYDATNDVLKYATTRPPAQATHELAATGYYMISFPLTPGSATPHELLCDDLGCANYYMWRWQGTGYQIVPTSAPGCQSTTLSMLEGYWILAAAATLGMRGTQTITDQVIPLQAGWNMVAAPHEATIDNLQVDNAGDVRSLAEAQAANWVLATFYGSHDGTGGYRTFTINQSPPDRLSLWHGYWVLAGVDCSLIVPVTPPPPPTATSAALRAIARPSWALDIRASSGSSTDTITIAAANSASDDFDGFALDRPKPPAAPGEGSLRMVLRAEGWRGTEPPPYNKAPGRQMPWSSELAMETKGTAEDAAEWQFSVTGGVEGEPVTLTWPELSGLPKDRAAILTDRDTGERTFMRTRAQYEFTAPDAGSSRNFAVTVKPAQQAGVLIGSFSVLPVRGAGGAEMAFSLAADASVDISVMNIAGRVVQRIREGVSVEAGMHTVTWTGRSLRGTALPNGVYLCVLEAKAADGQRARRVCPLSVRR